MTEVILKELTNEYSCFSTAQLRINLRCNCWRRCSKNM